MAPQSSSTSARFNHLRRGSVYRATMAGDDVVVGEYLGMEAPFGGRAILLRHATGTESIPLGEIVVIRSTAA